MTTKPPDNSALNQRIFVLTKRWLCSGKSCWNINESNQIYRCQPVNTKYLLFRFPIYQLPRVVKLHKNTRTYGCRNKRIQENTDTGIYEHKNIRIQEYTNTGTYGYRNIRTQEHTDTGIYEHKNIRIHEYTNTRTYGYTNIRTQEHTNIRRQEHMILEHTNTRTYGYRNLWTHEHKHMTKWTHEHTHKNASIPYISCP